MFCLSRLSIKLISFSLLALPAVAAEVEEPLYLGSQTPYVAQQSWQSYQTAPAGYQLVFTELVARHGARTLAHNSDQVLYQIWLEAEKKGALTPLGKQLGPQLQALLAADKKLGYGQLTQLGKEEHQQLALRLYQRDAALFQQAIQQGQKISVWHSGLQRAEESAANFVDGLTQAQPALAPLVLPAQKDQELLYFHKTANSEPYRHYLKKNRLLRNTLHEITDQSTSHKMAHMTLTPLFNDDFIARLENTQYRFTVDGRVVEPDDLATARLLYDVYSITPGMSNEGHWSFSRFIPKKAAVWFAYLNDAEAFYKKGPAFKGQDITYRLVKPLADDFFAAIQHLSETPTPEVARLRFTHAEVIAPLAAFLQLPGSDKPATLLSPYRYKNNPWRGAQVIPMAANMQWDVYRDNQQHYLVRMLYNEQEMPFKAACHPVAPNSFYYDFNELKRCYQYGGS
ncbi:histidine-type phosphatase [Tolumonas lignilytica]|uniref:histidine-type phosphatase n=1 Tax=Tolumonas lignilytica TaxID=1283284 RepID=UPI0004646221|nr:histidine-type phosphatase [Tolumonas lignilytica]